MNINQDSSDDYIEPITEKEILPILRSKANSKFLGSRLPQYIFLSTQEKKDSSKFQNFIQKQFGQAPRYVDSTDIDRSIRNIENYLFNNGYFNGVADFSVEENDSISSTIVYNVYPKDQHVYGNASFEFADSSIIEDIVQDIQLTDYIKKGKSFSVDDLNQLRNEMVINALENGYYDFSPNSIYIEPDTLQNNLTTDLYVVVENQRDSLYNRQFYIRDIYVKMGQGIDDSYSKPFNFKGIDYSQSEIIKVKPQVLNRFIILEEGELYSRTKHLNTINKLYDLPIVKYANIEFQRVRQDSLQATDSLFLDVFIDANAQNLMRARIEPTVSQFEGPSVGLELGFEHRNIFGGGELFDLTISGRLESVNNAENDRELFGTQIIDVNPEIVIPRLSLIENVKPDIYENTINQRTTIGASYGFQNYVGLYRLESFGISQTWEWQSSPHNKHALSLVDISSIDTLKVEPLYRERIEQFPSLGFALQPRLILGSNYTYTYSNRLKRTEEQSFYNFSGTIDLSGQMARLLFGKEGESINFGDRVVSEYVRSLLSFTHHQPFKNTSTQWVNHIQGGIALATRTEEEAAYIPAVKQFFLGGSSSMRAWRPRSLGPGTFQDENVNLNNNVDQRGDIMFEYNSELRYPLTRVFGLPLNGALFSDVGNIWSRREPEGQAREGAVFRSGSFYKELAVGVGTGLRLDIQNFLTIRTDFSWQIRDPSLPEDQRWVYNPFTFEKMLPQLGIGYPFEN